ncbi:MAG: D-alanine--D-alanine ligase [Nanoarchaeota archaeon]
MEKYAEFDSIETINDLAEAIKANSHEVEVINVNKDIKKILKSKKKQIDLVFNVAEGLCGEEREALVPRICEKLNIPFTAAGSQTLINTLNKAKTKEILRLNGINTTKFQVLNHENEEIEGLAFPLLVKPLLEGSSKGLFNENLINNKEDLKKIVKKITERYNQPVIVEEFLKGREFTISVIGYDEPIVLPIVEILFDHLPKGLHPMDSYEAKWIYDNPGSNMDPLACPAAIDENLKSLIEAICIKTFKALDCKDWARIDIRLDKNNVPNILEVNALPGFMKNPKENSRLPKAAYAAGWSYERLIAEVIKSAASRWKIC